MVNKTWLNGTDYYGRSIESRGGFDRITPTIKNRGMITRLFSMQKTDIPSCGISVFS
ncbi:MAG: hypothetical protein Q7U47_12475 [Paludibacter sp.]|nr:hypothetical protein [Paludibacter sp.]